MPEQTAPAALDLFDLSGKTALITGSYRGLGYVIAQGLAEAGAHVVLNGRNGQALEEAAAGLRGLGFSASASRFDVADQADVDRAISTLERERGRIDILVNNAGVQQRGPLHEVSVELWQQIQNTNLTGAFIVGARAARGMMASGGGKIINVCSLAAEIGRRGIGPYSAAKGGLKMLTRAMCADWASENIQVNAIGPGFFLSDMTRALADNPQFNAWLIERTPTRRWGDPRELIGPVLLLASRAGDFVNGQMILVDGGIQATM